MEIQFRNLYASPKEGEYTNAVIVYTKRPWMVNQRKTENGFAMEYYTAQYIKRLSIDLWFAVFHFKWLTKEIK